MNLKSSYLWVPNFSLRLISLSPTLLFALPAFAETIMLPACQVPEIFRDSQSQIWDCSQPLPPVEPSPPEAAPKSLAPLAPASPIPGITESPLTGTAATTTLAPQPIANTAPAMADAVPPITPAPKPIGSPTPAPEQSLPSVPEPTATPTTSPAPPTPPAAQSVPEPAPAIQRIQTIGNTALPQEVIDSITKLAIGKPATLQELCKVSEQLNQAYRSRGYVVATALPLIDRQTQSTLKNGTAGIAILEGCLESIEVVGLQKLKADYVTSRLALGATTPFNANPLNDRLALLQRDPKIGKLEVLGLSAGRQIGTSALQIKVTEANFLTGFVGVDNYVSPILGGTRAIAGLNYRNFTNNGDDLSAVYYRSTGGELYGFDFNYQLPINPMDGQLQFRVSPNVTDARLASSTQPNQTFQYTATGLATEFNYRQPLVHTSREEFALGFGVFSQDGSTSTASQAPDKNKVRGLRFVQEYNSLDGGGNWSLRSQFNLGLGILGATVKDNPPDGRFLSWQGQLQRVQSLGQDNYTIAQLQFQLTPDRLVPDQQFVVGGIQSVRGYRQNIRFGDNGVRLSLENRTILARDSQGQANLQFAINADAAQVWNSGGENIPESFLSSVGAGILWEPIPKLYTRFDYGVPLRSISDRGNSFQDSGFNMSVGYAF